MSIKVEGGSPLDRSAPLGWVGTWWADGEVERLPDGDQQKISLVACLPFNNFKLDLDGLVTLLPWNRATREFDPPRTHPIATFIDHHEQATPPVIGGCTIYTWKLFMKSVFAGCPVCGHLSLVSVDDAGRIEMVECKRCHAHFKGALDAFGERPNPWLDSASESADQ